MKPFWGREILPAQNLPVWLDCTSSWKKSVLPLIPPRWRTNAFIRLTRLIAWIFPFVSMLVVYPLSSLGKRFLGEKNAIIPALLYLCLPNVLLDPTLYGPDAVPFVVRPGHLAHRPRCRQKCHFLSSIRWLDCCCIYRYLFRFRSSRLIFIAFLLIGMHGLFAWTGISVSISQSSHERPSSIWRYIKLGLGVLLGYWVYCYLLIPAPARLQHNGTIHQCDCHPQGT